MLKNQKLVSVSFFYKKKGLTIQDSKRGQQLIDLFQSSINDAKLSILTQGVQGLFDQLEFLISITDHNNVGMDDEQQIVFMMNIYHLTELKYLENNEDNGLLFVHKKKL